MRVAMYLFGDPTHDGRVLREAGSLAAAGHQVTLLARMHAARRGSLAAIPGVRIVDVPPPAVAWFTAEAIRRPWRLGRWVVTSWLGLRRPAPARLARAVAATLLAPWVAIGTAWHRLHRGGEAAGDGLLDYVLYWRASVLPWCRAAGATAPAADVHHAHDLSALPAAISAARRGGVVVYDSHEIFLESGRHARRSPLVRRMLARWERKLAAHAAAVVTVNAGVAGELERRLRPRRLLVVHNCPPRWMPPGRDELSVRRRAGLAGDVPIALYHGGLSRHRGLEVIAAAVLEPGMERLQAVYMGYGPERPAVDALVADPRYGGRLHVLDAVAPDEVVDAVAGADVAVMPIGPSTLNHVLSTPNKLFEALAAGVPAVVSDFPEMRGIVLDDPAGPLGAVCEPASPASVAAAIRMVLEQPPPELAAMRARCRQAADTRWNWETEAAGLVDLYASLESGGSRSALAGEQR